MNQIIRQNKPWLFGCCKLISIKIINDKEKINNIEIAANKNQIDKNLSF